MEVKANSYFFGPEAFQGCTKDNAEIGEIWIEPQELTLNDIGEKRVKVFVSDMSGNIGSAETLVTIVKANSNCENQLWAVNSGAWDDPNNWSDKENGIPIGVVPCEKTSVNISGHSIDFNSEEEISVKSIRLIESSEKTTLNIQTGNLKTTAFEEKGSVELKQSSYGKLDVIKK